MSKKILRTIMIFLIVVLSIIGIQTKVEARNLTGKGDVIKAGWWGRYSYYSAQDRGNPEAIWLGKGSDNTFCIEHNGPLWLSRDPIPPLLNMNVLYHININGLNSSIYKGNSSDQSDLIAPHSAIENGVFAWILNQENHDFAADGDYSDKQLAIYNYVNKWFAANDLQGLARDVSNLRNPGWATKGEEYAKTLQTEGSGPSVVEKNTEPTVETAMVGDTEYIKVGPYAAAYTGNLEYVKVYDQNDKELSPIFATYEGDTLKTSQNPSEIILSEKQFFILLPEDGNTERINKIDFGAYQDTNNIEADVWILTNGKYQNMISTDTKSDPKRVSASISFPGIDLITDLEVIKVNKDNHDVKLKGVSFKFKNERTGKWLSQDENGKNIYIDNDSDAKVFTTDENGYFKIEKIVIGTYRAYEQEGNPNYGYEVLQEGKVVQASAKKEPQIIENNQIKIKVSGFVWVDEPIESKKAGVRNDKYNDGEYDKNDTLLEGIKVKLKLKGENGEPDTVEQETTTGAEGEYLFEDVLIKNLDRYYIEFEYNGLVYTNVLPWNKLDGENLDAAENVSKAAENEVTRGDFNSNFGAVEGQDPEKNTGVLKHKSGEIYDSLEYTRGEGEDEHKSFFNYEGHSFPIHAETTETGYNIKKQFTWGMEEVKFINLGLYKREQADLSLQKDIQNARVGINGYEHTYNYDNRFQNMGDYEEGFNVGVKFVNTRGTAKYTRPIYKSDLAWKDPNGNQDNELKVGITYHLRVINEATKINAKVNSIVDYFDENYTVEKVGRKVDEKTGEVTEELENGKDYSVDETVNNGYKTLKITPSSTEIIKSLNSEDEVQSPENNETPSDEPEVQIPEHDMPNQGESPIENQTPEGYDEETENKEIAIRSASIQEENNNEQNENNDEQNEDVAAAQGRENYQDIYVYFTMSREKVKEIAVIGGTNQEEPENAILDNIAEIASYTSFDQQGNLYAAIDEDSAPGNVIVGNESTYEDDTDKAPAFILQVDDDDGNGRKIRGNVFEDMDANEAEEILKGNGKLDDGENPIQNVKVTLVPIEVDEATGNEKEIKYNEEGENGEVIINPDRLNVTTGEKGDYEIIGFAPGDYKIRFTWGNGAGQINRKVDPTTTSNDPIDTRLYESTGQPTKEEWDRKIKDPKWYEQEDPRYTDAIDDWETRKNIDANYADIVYENSMEKLSAETSPEMISETPRMKLTVELENYEEGVTPITDPLTVMQVEGDETKTYNNNNGEIDKNNQDESKEDVRLEYVIENIDFGIIGRPKQELTLTKRVSHVKYTTPMGEVIINADISEDGKLDPQPKGVTYLPKEGNSGNSSAGMLRMEIDSELLNGSLEATYEFKVVNSGQIDYADREWHLYIDKDQGTIDPSKRVTLSASEIVDYLDSDWGFAPEINSGWEEITAEYARDEKEKEIVINGNTQKLDMFKDAIFSGPDSDVAGRRILCTHNLEKALAPGEENTTELTVSKVVATGDDVDLSNETEITNIVRGPSDPSESVGAPVEESPGNYLPSTMEGEADTGIAEAIRITPPTGDSTMRNYIIYTSVGILALAIFGAGVIIIKKKALKK